MERELRRAVGQARENGQALFLSSHQLAEVEAVCDRVAILRAGRLVDVASVAELRRLHRTEVSATFSGTPPDLAATPGVAGLHRDGAAALRFTLNGSPGPALDDEDHPAYTMGRAAEIIGCSPDFLRGSATRN